MEPGEIIEIGAPALAASMMIALVHAPMGIEVLRRGIVFIDLAVAQIAGLCVVLVNLWQHDPGWWQIQTVAASAAIAAAIFFRWVERKFPGEQEAIIGSCFVLAASLALLALAGHPQGGEEIQHILSGQILFVSWTKILSFLPLFAVVFCLWFMAPGIRRGLPFFLAFALVVTASVQLVGVYVVFASLILPALAVNAIAGRKERAAILCGAGAALAGISFSVVTDQPAGPVLVFSFAAVAIAFRIAHAMQRSR